MKKHFNKNVIKTKEEEEFKSGNTCWICKKLKPPCIIKYRDYKT